MKGLEKWFRRQSAARKIAFGFATLIMMGSLLLMMPFSLREGVILRYVDALYMATSAVCVTGLAVVDPGDTFSAVGQCILAMLIHTGGLGVTAIGAGIILAMGKKMNLRERNLVREAMNLDSGRAVICFVKDIFLTTLLIEGIGAFLAFWVFVRDYPPLRAAGISIFHSIAAFNNAGFDILGNMQNLAPYRENVFLNLVTCGLIFLGGIGFLVIRELWDKRFRWKRLSMHTRVVLSMSGCLLAGGALCFRLTEEISWLGAVFTSFSTRTAGFSTYSLGTFSTPGLMIAGLLMFIGASPGSTGGGIKTSTFFVLLQGVRSAATNTSEKAFHYAIPRDAFRKSAVIMLLAMGIVFCGTFGMTLMEREIPLEDIIFEMISAFSTTGLSTGISPKLGDGSKLLTICMMYMGRLGPMTVATLWHFSRGERIRLAEGEIAIG